jgi:hypothetical protein
MWLSGFCRRDPQTTERRQYHPDGERAYLAGNLLICELANWDDLQQYLNEQAAYCIPRCASNVLIIDPLANGTFNSSVVLSPYFSGL